MAEAGFNINYAAFHFDIHKTIAYRINNRFVQTKLAGDRPRSDRQTNKRPKGPHIVHLSTMCNLFEESAKADIFVY